MDFTARDRAVLRHVGRYRVTFEPIVSTLFFGGKPCAHVFTRFHGDGTVTFNHKRVGTAMPSGVSWVQLTPEGCKAAGLSKERAQALSESALRQHVAVVFWCCANPKQRRYRLSNEKVRRLLGDDAVSDNVAFVAARERGDYCVYRVYVPDTDTVTTIAKTRALAEAMLASPMQREWAAGGQLGLAILHEEPAACHSIREAVQARDGGALSLAQTVRVTVGLGPSPQTIAAALRSLRKRKGARGE